MFVSPPFLCWDPGIWVVWILGLVSLENRAAGDAESHLACEEHVWRRYQWSRTLTVDSTVSRLVKINLFIGCAVWGLFLQLPEKTSGFLLSFVFYAKQKTWHVELWTKEQSYSNTVALVRPVFFHLFCRVAWNAYSLSCPLETHNLLNHQELHWLGSP